MTIIQLVNVSDITDAYEAQLNAWPALADLGATVEDAEPVNDSPERCPWVGIYAGRVGFPSRTLGLGGGYRRQVVSLAVAMTASSADSGKDCKRRLNTLVQAVGSATCSDESIGGTVLTLGDVELVYSDYAFVGAAFFQQAVLRFDAITNVIAS